MRECYKRKVLFKHLIAGIFNIHTKRNIFLLKSKSLSLEYLSQIYGFGWLIAKSFFSPWFPCRRPKFAFFADICPLWSSLPATGKMIYLVFCKWLPQHQKALTTYRGPTKPHKHICQRKLNHQVKNHTLNHTDELQRYTFSHSKS